MSRRENKKKSSAERPPEALAALPLEGVTSPAQSEECRLAALSRAIAAGEYRVSSGDLAERLMQRMRSR